MVRLQQILTVGGTFAVAAGIGFIMQNEDALAHRIGGDSSYDPIAQISGTPVLTSFTGASADGLGAGHVAPVQQGVAGLSAESCEISMTAETLPGALVALTVDAPCRANLPGKIYHRGLTYSVLADADGIVQTTVPALAQDALFIIAFDTGEGQMVAVDVPDADGWERMVLQWQGDGSGLQMTETDATEGALMTLGTYGPHAAQVMSYPAGTGGIADLAVAVEVSAANCDRPIDLQVWRTGDSKMQPVRAGAPGCDAVGQVLHLKSFETDLALAAN
ncbi:hypothetical protein AADZ90_003315 [Aestuariibius sp. 2305UL40-4]|uniref:hypothetical protein n=1 Tax=Aestuariibius violaceus TaxID=3234132 RepID=UPI00345EFDBD